MTEIISWLQSYSLPVVLLLLFGGALIYVMKVLTDKSVSSVLERYTRKIELRLERRSEFEQRVLLDRYTLVRELSARLESILTNINRSHGGHPVPDGFFVEAKGLKDIVPLTELLQELVVHRVVITDLFFEHLNGIANDAVKFANVQNPPDVESIKGDIVNRREAFQSEFNSHFGIDRILP